MKLFYFAAQLFTMNSDQQFAVVFDMDGVIVDTNPYHKIAIRQFCEMYGFQLTEEQLKEKVYGRTNKDWINNLFEGKLSPHQIQIYANQKEELFREIYDPHAVALEGLSSFLDLLDQKKIPKAIATSAPYENLRFVLEKTGFSGRFEIMLDERFVEKGKPDPEIYLKTAVRLQLPPARCIVFEDSLAGVQSAFAAGCKVVGVTTTHSAEELPHLDFAIGNFSEINWENLSRLFS